MYYKRPSIVKVAMDEEIEKIAFLGAAAKLLAKPVMGAFKALTMVGKGFGLMNATGYVNALKGLPRALKAKGSPFNSKL